MRALLPFLKLVRLPNLIFIILAQSLFQFCIYYAIYPERPAGDLRQFILLVIASVFIAAGGNIINDYFDLNIDRINKPDKVILDRFISRRKALVWHLVLSVGGVLLTALAVNPFSRWYLVVANGGCVLLLWIYSARFKRDVLIGNVIISLLTAWTILIIFLSKFSIADAFHYGPPEKLKFFRFAILYAGFAFVISLIREAIKDIEDMPGDSRYHCHTMPIAWGVRVTKVYIAVWVIILFAVLVVIEFYVLQFRWWLAVVYCFLFILIPLLILFKKLLGAERVEDFSTLSRLTKAIMLSGIFSMIFFYIYV
jgi:4-hydroxybenzoate polyprenyltransferase